LLVVKRDSQAIARLRVTTVEKGQAIAAVGSGFDES
jgi:hypothetical protein